MALQDGGELPLGIDALAQWCADAGDATAIERWQAIGAKGCKAYLTWRFEGFTFPHTAGLPADIDQLFEACAAAFEARCARLTELLATGEVELVYGRPQGDQDPDVMGKAAWANGRLHIASAWFTSPVPPREYGSQSQPNWLNESREQKNRASHIAASVGLNNQPCSEAAWSTGKGLPTIGILTAGSTNYPDPPLIIRPRATAAAVSPAAGAAGGAKKKGGAPVAYEWPWLIGKLQEFAACHPELTGPQLRTALIGAFGKVKVPRCNDPKTGTPRPPKLPGEKIFKAKIDAFVSQGQEKTQTRPKS